MFIVFKVIEIDLQFLFILAYHFANSRLTFHNNNRILVKGLSSMLERHPDTDGIHSNPKDKNTLCI